MNKQTKTSLIKGGKKQQSAASKRRRQGSYWLGGKKTFTVKKPVSQIPPWLAPLIVTFLIIALVFWGMPRIIKGVQRHGNQNEKLPQASEPLLFGPDTRVVIAPVADLFARPDLKAERIAQLLYNEPVYLSDEKAPSGYVAVYLPEGLKGYMLSADLTARTSSIEPSLYPYRAIVLAPTKRIMSHAEKGTLLVELVLGTNIYLDYRGAGVASVRLADDSAGWISEDGVIILPAQEKIAVPQDFAQAFCNTALLFTQGTALDHGMSIRGISMEGLVHVSALVNGIALPRTIEGLTEAGQLIARFSGQEKGDNPLSFLHKGDLLFFQDKIDSIQIGILIEEGQVLTIRPGQNSVRLVDFDTRTDTLGQLVMVRRLYGT